MRNDPRLQAHPAVELIFPTGDDPRLVLTCEHASNHLPHPWAWPDEDRHLVDDHWAWDPGAADLTRALAGEFGCGAVLSRFSRLLVDPNRQVDSPTLFRQVADGQAVGLNRHVADREERITGFYLPYHAAADAMIGHSSGASVLGMHSFTPVYEGTPRQVEIGVLYDVDEEAAHVWTEVLRGLGWRVELNEPWSGRAGLMYSPQRHATAHGRQAIELEIRQDISTDPARRQELVEGLAAAAEAWVSSLRD